MPGSCWPSAVSPPVTSPSTGGRGVSPRSSSRLPGSAGTLRATGGSSDETYLKVAGKWTYLYRAVDQPGQVIDVLLSVRRDLAAARRFVARAVRAGTVPVEVTTGRAAVYPRVLGELVSSALHIVEQYANNPIEADHGRLKARLRPMRGVKRHRSARIPSPPVMPSCRICAADTTTLPPRSLITTGYGRPSMTWQSPCEQRVFE
jgi:hypothetical protein